jgi:hypothetical protein
MEDFNALALALSGAVGQLRACLILSRDGLVVGAYPPAAEQDAKHAWIRLASLGELERGFVQFAAETWCYVSRGPYAALALTSSAVRPGLVIDQMEEALLEAEQARAAHDGLHPHESATAPTSRPRSPLHPELKPLERPLVLERASAEPASASVGLDPLVPGDPVAVPSPVETPAIGEPSGLAAAPETGEQETPDEPPGPASEGARPDGPVEAKPLAGEPETPEPPGGPDPDEVDPFTLAREFSALLQDDRNPADG